MNEVMTINRNTRMSSAEIAVLLGKRHDNVLRDIEKMLTELHGADRLLSFEETIYRPNPKGGAPIPSRVYMLPWFDTTVLITGYSISKRAAVIKRWAELEEQGRPAHALVSPEVLQLAMSRIEQQAVEIAELRGAQQRTTERLMAMVEEGRRHDARMQHRFAMDMQALERSEQVRARLAGQRKGNLLHLVNEWSSGSPKEFAARAGCSVSLMRRLLSPRQPFGEVAARRMELRLGLPEKALDKPNLGQVREEGEFLN